MAEKTQTRRGPLGWVKRHKKLTIFLVIVLVAALVLVNVLGKTDKAATGSYQFVRTTVLTKTTLSDTVSVTGTVKAGSSASVTASDSVKTYKVTAVNVAVGDTVRKGDVIATLDTTDVEKQIANAQLQLSDTRTDARKNYTQAVEDQTTNLATAQENLDKAQKNYDTLGIDDYYTSMASAANSGKTTREIVTDWYTRYAEEIAGYENTLANLNIQLTQAQQDGDTARADGLQGQIADYTSRENIAKGQCSIPELGLQGFDAVSQTYNKIEQYREALEQAQQSYQNSTTSASRSVDNAETKLAQSQREDDTLTKLQTALENCTLTATMDGTITALDATVGAVCSGTVATIQDVDNLTVEVTIPASSVGRLKTGLQCNITSDATDDTVTGTLTRIDPVANDSGSFGATVTVNGQDSGLLVGISAKVEIVISTKDNVFTVPRDAVGTNDDGSTYVLRKTGGEGVDMTFEQVAVTEGDKTEAERVFGASINTWAVNELVAAYDAVKDDQVKEIIEDYKAKYDVDPALLDAKYDSLFIAAKEEAAMVNMMRANGCTAGVDNFEDLGALPQLPGVGPQRFPSEYGWGFSAEGDWKTAVLVRIGAVMGYGLEGGASLMEDYSYNFTEGDELDMGSHMLEVSPSIGTIAKPKLEIHPLGIGGKADPVRLVFSGKPAKDAVVVSMSDVRERFRLLMDVVDVVEPQGSLKELPCARAVWEPKPSLKTAVECWITAGGSHHTCMTTSVGREAWEDFARIAGVELAVIDENTTARQFEKELELSEMYHRLNNQH